MSEAKYRREPKAGELYRLPGTEGWCRHGLVIIQESARGLIAMDTYYGNGDGYHMVKDVKDRLEFILDLNDAMMVWSDAWELFEDEDRARIPSGGKGAIYYVRKGARASHSKMVKKLESRIRQARADAEYAVGLEKRLVEELAKLRAERVHRPAVDGPCRPDCGICAAALAAKPC